MLGFFSNISWKSAGIGAAAGMVLLVGVQKLYAAAKTREAAAKAKAPAADKPAA